jgi:hypothetical protein
MGGVADRENLSDKERSKSMWVESNSDLATGSLANTAEVVAGWGDLSPPQVALILDMLGIASKDEYYNDKLSDEYREMKERARCIWLSTQEASVQDGPTSMEKAS